MNINILNLNTLAPTATLSGGFTKNEGVEFVIVGGVVAYEKGVYDNTLSGELF
mgnify:CR=1 FL=1